MARFYAGASAQQDRPFNRRVKPATTQEQLESAERWLAAMKADGFTGWELGNQIAMVARLREQAKKEAL